MNLEVQTSGVEFHNAESKQFDITFEEYERRLALTDWEWHLAVGEDLETKKSTYESMVSCMETLRAKYYQDAILFAKVKKIHNQYAPTKYQIP